MSLSRSRGHRVATALLGVCLPFCVAACSKPKHRTSANPSASGLSVPEPAASTEQLAAPAASNRRVPIAREALVPPPLSAPADAVVGPGGVRFQELRAGTGESPGPLDTLVLDYTIWKADGSWVASSYPEPEAAAFSVSSLPPELRNLLTRLKCGGKARYWLPRAALAGWKPREWPDADLVFELEPLRVTHVVVRDATGVLIDPLPYQAPDGAGAPPSALKTASGLAYTYLAHATNPGPHPEAADHLDVVATVYVVDGLAVKLLEKGIKTATTLARAPAKLSEVLSQLSSGDQVRIWMPKGLGQQVVADAGSRDTIVDLAVTFQR